MQGRVVKIDSLSLFTAGLKPPQAYNYEPLASNVCSVNTAGVVITVLVITHSTVPVNLLASHELNTTPFLSKTTFNDR